MQSGRSWLSSQQFFLLEQNKLRQRFKDARPGSWYIVQANSAMNEHYPGDNYIEGTWLLPHKAF